MKLVIFTELEMTAWQLQCSAIYPNMGHMPDFLVALHCTSMTGFDDRIRRLRQMTVLDDRLGCKTNPAWL